MTVIPLINTPAVVAEDLLWMIRQKMAQHPRSRQTVIGPSELGDPCTRTLIHKLLGHPEPAGAAGSDGWLAQIGTAVHGWLEDMVGSVNTGQFQSRFLTEQRVMVGEVGGQQIWGHADLFDIDTSTVVDWKVVGARRLDMFRSTGPGPTYRRQAHLYGRGLSLAGQHVETVMIFFLPRERELRTAWAWAEPYDEGVALDALSRANGLLDLIASWGVEQVLSLYPPCATRYCRWCGVGSRRTLSA